MPKAPNKTIRPVLLTSETTFSRYAPVLRRLLVGLADHSLPITLVCPPNADIDPVACGCVDVVRYPLLDVPLMDWFNRDRLLDALEKFKPTILHALCEDRADMVRQIANEFKCPYVLSVHSLQRRFHQLSLSAARCASLLAPAPSVAESIKTFHPAFAGRVQVVRMGTFVEDECVCFLDPFEMPSLVMAHPLDRVSDFVPVLMALRDLGQEGYEFMTVVMGHGRADYALHQMLVRLKLVDRVTVIPELKPWRSVLAAGDIFIQPQPLPFFNPFLLEAMAVGMAVVACKGGVDDLILEGQTALVFQPGDQVSIRCVIRRLLDHQDQAKQIANQAMQRLRSQYTVYPMVDDLIGVYRQAQERPPVLEAIG